MMLETLPIRPFTQPGTCKAHVPGSKSITNRALLLAALNEGPVTLCGALFSEDAEVMVTALRALGIETSADAQNQTVTVQGQGGMIPVATGDIFVGNAGTVARFLVAALALRWGGSYRLDGTKAMRRRPMRGLLETLESCGCAFAWEAEPYHFPFKVKTQGLRKGVWEVNAEASSQILSALLLVASLTDGPVRVQQHGNTVSKPFITMTKRMIAAFRRDGAIPDEASDGYEFKPESYRIPNGNYKVEPDATAASYFLSLPMVIGSSVEVSGLSPDSLQGDVAYHRILDEIGFLTTFTHNGLLSEVPAGALSGGTFDFNDISDTFLTLAALAPLLSEPVTITGIAHTRKQETDRVTAMANELRKLGQGIEEKTDSITINPNREKLHEIAHQGIEIDTYEDHRVAMSFGILGCADLRGNGQPWLTINNPLCCAKTFPGFFDELERLRLSSHA
jgi:3-phosphoshikimate 1-carboxyvinyltransferase